jgi:hypothetical protein
MEPEGRGGEERGKSYGPGGSGPNHAGEPEPTPTKRLGPGFSVSGRAGAWGAARRGRGERPAIGRHHPAWSGLGPPDPGVPFRSGPWEENSPFRRKHCGLWPGLSESRDARASAAGARARVASGGAGRAPCGSCGQRAQPAHRLRRGLLPALAAAREAPRHPGRARPSHRARRLRCLSQAPSPVPRTRRWLARPAPRLAGLPIIHAPQGLMAAHAFAQCSNSRASAARPDSEEALFAAPGRSRCLRWDGVGMVIGVDLLQYHVTKRLREYCYIVLDRSSTGIHC